MGRTGDPGKMLYTVGGKGTFSVLWRKNIFVSNLLYVDVSSGLFKFCPGYFRNLQAKCQEKSLYDFRLYEPSLCKTENSAGMKGSVLVT